MGKSKQARAHEFTEKARKEIYARDFGQCIFCIKKYNMQGSTWYSQQILSVMHYIPRSAGGLGIPMSVPSQYVRQWKSRKEKGDVGDIQTVFAGALSGME